MFNKFVVEMIKPGDWRITTGLPSPGKISIETFSSKEEALKALREGSYSFE